MLKTFRPVTDAEARLILIRTAMDALTTGQADTSRGGIAALDSALWRTLESADAQELDTI